MSVNAKSNSVKIGNLLKNTFYNIPIYQRKYSWEEEQVKQLWEDIVQAFEEDKNTGYFIGSVVLIEPDKVNGKFRYDIIDGQQRITTISLMFLIFWELYEGNEKLKEFLWEKEDSMSNEILRRLEIEIFDYQDDWNKLLPSYDSTHSVFKKILDENNKSFSSISKKEKNKLHDDNPYLANALCLRELVDEFVKHKGRDKLSELIRYIEKEIEMIEIICDNQQSALRIFQTLNTRGLDLTVSDLVKAECLKQIQEWTEEEQREFNNRWIDTEKDLKKIGITMDKALMIYTETHRFTDESMGGKTEISGKEKEFKDYILNDQFKNGLKVKDFIDDFSSIAEIICEYLKKEIYTFGNSDSLFFLLKEQTKTELWYHPLVQFRRFYKKNKYTKTDFEKLLNFLVVILYRGLILKIPSTTLRSVLRNITIWIYDAKTVDDIIIEFQKLKSTSVFFDKKKIEDTLKKTLPTNVRTPLVHLCALRNKKIDFYAHYKKLHVEHILPQEYKAGYDWSEEEADKHLNTIGNLVLIESKINIGMGNKWFETKRKKYKSSLLSEVKKLASYEAWIPDECSKRNKEMIKVVLELLSLKND